MAGKQSISEQLMQALRFGGLGSDHLKEVVGVLDTMHQQGFRIKKVLTKGTPPVLDRVEAQSVLPLVELKTLLPSLLANGRIQSIVMFPIGIPNPEEFQTEITVQ